MENFSLIGNTLTNDLILKAGCEYFLGISSWVFMRIEISPQCCVFMIVPKSAAKQFCLLDYAQFKALTAHELLRSPKELARDGSHSSKLQLWAERFNLVSNWTALMILTFDNLPQRTRVLKQFIKLAWECLALNNFNTCYSIVAGLNSSPVQRLTKTWKVCTDKLLVQTQPY